MLAWTTKQLSYRALGNVGYHAAKFFHEGGAKVIGLAEFEGAIYNPKGLDVEAVMAHRKKTGSLLNFPRCQKLKKISGSFRVGLRYFGTCSP